jgi:hypothetical protein
MYLRIQAQMLAHPLLEDEHFVPWLALYHHLRTLTVHSRLSCPAEPPPLRLIEARQQWYLIKERNSCFQTHPHFHPAITGADGLAPPDR